MFSDEVDLLFTEDGDLLFEGQRGDFKKAYASEYETLTQTILKRVQSSDEEWEIDGTVCANLNYLLGSHANEETLEQARGLLYNCLTRDGYIAPEKINIQSEYLNNNILLFNISIFINDNDFYNVYNLGFSYDIRNNRCTPRYLKETSN